MKYIVAILYFIISINSKAQVPVIKEPRHKPVLVNDYVRLLDVHINPHDTTLYHIHAAPSVIVFISKSKIGSQKMGEAPVAPNDVFSGNTSYAAYEKKPVTHRVFNAGDSVFHVMDIELVKQKPSTDSCMPITQPNFETTINKNLVRVYKFNVDAHQNINIHKSICAHLLVCIDGTITSSNKTIKTGDYIFFDANSDIPLINNSNNNTSCVLLELK